MRYIKKPIVIDAFKWTGGEGPEWCVKKIKDGTVLITNSLTHGLEMRIKTLEGVMIANSGDFIIKGIHGELYPCKPDIFEESYEATELPEVDE